MPFFPTLVLPRQRVAPAPQALPAGTAVRIAVHSLRPGPIPATRALKPIPAPDAPKAELPPEARLLVESQGPFLPYIAQSVARAWLERG